MPFSTQRVPAIFMQLINEVRHEQLYKGVLVHLDNVLIYTLEEHMKLVIVVLKKL